MFCVLLCLCMCVSRMPSWIVFHARFLSLQYNLEFKIGYQWWLLILEISCWFCFWKYILKEFRYIIFRNSVSGFNLYGSFLEIVFGDSFEICFVWYYCLLLISIFGHKNHIRGLVIMFAQYFCIFLLDINFEINSDVSCGKHSPITLLESFPGSHSHISF